MPKLTATQVKAISEQGKYGDGDGLYLNVSGGGTKSWVQRISIDGRRRDVGLGGYPTVSLAQARRRAADNRSAVADGRDPLAEKRRASIPTFRQAAIAVHGANKPRWRNARHTASWLQSLETYAMPILGGMPLDRIHQSDVLRALTPIWSTRPETARRVRQRIRTVLRWGMAHGYIDRNAAGEVIDGALPPMPKVKEHLRALPYQEVREALATVEASNSSLAAKFCLRFLVLTAARSGEARGAMWAEINREEREWRIPGSRMKNGAEHRVPLSDAAVAVLEQARRLNDGSGLVFPSPLKPGKPLSDMTLTKILRDTGLAEQATVHGFRSSFRTWALEQTNTPWAAAEAALAHTLGSDVEQAYVRSSLLDRRRDLMGQWAAYLDKT